MAGTTREIAKTGIPGMDTVLGGGIPKGSVVTISGGTGCGKTTFAMQFLVMGAQNQDEPGLYISFDEQKIRIAENMRQFGWDMFALEREKKVVFIEYPIHEVDQFLSNESTVKDLINLLGVKRLVIDPIAPIALTFQDKDKRRVGFAKLVETIRSWGCTVLILSDDSGGVSEGVPSTTYGFEDVCDGLVRLYYLHRKGVRKRYVEAIKLRGMHHDGRIVEMEIGAKGVSVYPKKALSI